MKEDRREKKMRRKRRLGRCKREEARLCKKRKQPSHQPTRWASKRGKGDKHVFAPSHAFTEALHLVVELKGGLTEDHAVIEGRVPDATQTQGNLLHHVVNRVALNEH